MKKLFVFIFLLSNVFITGSAKIQDNYIPKSGYVPDKQTAVKIAEAIWLPIYGNSIYNKKPFKARLKNQEIWIVEGSLPEGMLGGVPYIEIQKSDCKVLKVIHGK